VTADGPFARVCLIGAGQAAAALGHGLRRAGHVVTAVTSAGGVSAATLADALGAVATDPVTAAASADVVVVAVPDAAIVTAVDVIAAAGVLHAGTSVLHCSGARPLADLDAARAAGARVGVLHPVAPLVPPDDPATLAGKPFGVEADDDDSWLRSLAAELGGRPVSLAGVDRATYHAGCVLASNLVVALGAASESVLAASGMSGDDARLVAAGLVAASGAAVAARGVPGALTGPARRGDDAVLRTHRDALAAVDPELAELYRLVSRRILGLLPPGDARDRTERALAP
jgi:predicted short-subunit dehydrogenase-like oxidoreductase (DUF2520 family)